MHETTEVLRQMQLQRVIGELNVLKMSYYNSADVGIEHFKCSEIIIDEITTELIDNFS